MLFPIQAVLLLYLYLYTNRISSFSPLHGRQISSKWSYPIKSTPPTVSEVVSELRQKVEIAPYNDIIPFLSEHVQESDQLLFLGASTDMSLLLAMNGYGTKKTGYMIVVDSNVEYLEECKKIAENNAELNALMNEGKLSFQPVDLTNMAEICKQSVFDAIIDYGALDTISGEDSLKCIDHLQNAVRLGNILVCLSKMEKEEYCAPFEQRFGWVQELDGDPGEISAWYRGKTNIQAAQSNFASLGLKMYVYTNVDNC